MGFFSDKSDKWGSLLIHSSYSKLFPHTFFEEYKKHNTEILHYSTKKVHAYIIHSDHVFQVTEATKCVPKVELDKIPFLAFPACF